ncbi:UNKNOWN [Stylonychia lemnae]|uniref:Uncharacterized protein n=1 Tax=Stylonychia lemnae TaxID=5949 RepID=A0A078ADK4_STYLE|nr:UNKNOWN [Stylonychia lemnae]|eukprot:CDW78958.1 UNKNOWN [Stylonychia lemnae]
MKTSEQEISYKERVITEIPERHKQPKEIIKKEKSKTTLTLNIIDNPALQKELYVPTSSTPEYQQLDQKPFDFHVNSFNNTSKASKDLNHSNNTRNIRTLLVSPRRNQINTEVVSQKIGQQSLKQDQFDIQAVLKQSNYEYRPNQNDKIMLNKHQLQNIQSLTRRLSEPNINIGNHKQLLKQKHKNLQRQFEKKSKKDMQNMNEMISDGLLMGDKSDIVQLAMMNETLRNQTQPNLAHWPQLKEIKISTCPQIQIDESKTILNLLNSQRGSSLTRRPMTAREATKIMMPKYQKSELKPGTYQTDIHQHGIKYTNNDFVKYFLLKKIINKFPLLKPLATVDQEKLFKIKKELLKIRIVNDIVEEDTLMNKTKSQFNQRQLSLMSNKNVKILMQVTAEHNPNGVAKEQLDKLFNDNKFYRQSNKPLGNVDTEEIDYYKKQKHSNIVEFLKQFRLQNEEELETKEDLHKLMQKKLTNSSFYDENDPEIQFLKNILATNRKIVLQNNREDQESDDESKDVQFGPQQRMTPTLNMMMDNKGSASNNDQKLIKGAFMSKGLLLKKQASEKQIRNKLIQVPKPVEQVGEREQWLYEKLDHDLYEKTIQIHNIQQPALTERGASVQSTDSNTNKTRPKTAFLRSNGSTSSIPDLNLYTYFKMLERQKRLQMQQQQTDFFITQQKEALLMTGSQVKPSLTRSQSAMNSPCKLKQKCSKKEFKKTHVIINHQRTHSQISQRERSINNGTRLIEKENSNNNTIQIPNEGFNLPHPHLIKQLQSNVTSIDSFSASDVYHIQTPNNNFTKEPLLNRIKSANQDQGILNLQSEQNAPQRRILRVQDLNEQSHSDIKESFIDNQKNLNIQVDQNTQIRKISQNTSQRNDVLYQQQSVDPNDHLQQITLNHYQTILAHKQSSQEISKNESLIARDNNIRVHMNYKSNIQSNVNKIKPPQMQNQSSSPKEQRIINLQTKQTFQNEEIEKRIRRAPRIYFLDQNHQELDIKEFKPKLKQARLQSAQKSRVKQNMINDFWNNTERTSTNYTSTIKSARQFMYSGIDPNALHQQIMERNPFYENRNQQYYANQALFHLSGRQYQLNKIQQLRLKRQRKGYVLKSNVNLDQNLKNLKHLQSINAMNIDLDLIGGMEIESKDIHQESITKLLKSRPKTALKNEDYKYHGKHTIQIGENFSSTQQFSSFQRPLTSRRGSGDTPMTKMAPTNFNITMKKKEVKGFIQIHGKKVEDKEQNIYGGKYGSYGIKHI